MGEATRRGSKAERIRQAHARIEALKPASETGGKCQTLITDFEPFDVRRFSPLDRGSVYATAHRKGV